MSDEKRYTERDLVLAKREGFVKCRTRAGYVDSGWCRLNKDDAALEFPFPTRTVPRVVEDPHDSDISYRVREDDIEYCKGVGRWVSLGSPSEEWSTDNHPTKSRVALWADLLAHPTEEVADV